jgi:hypothetical protein
MGYLEAKALPHQFKFINSEAKYPALVSGLGAGKTEALIFRTLKFITEVPRASIGLYEPTVDLIKRILYPRFIETFSNAGLPFKLNKTDGILEIWMPTGKAEIIFRSMDNYSRIVGYETHHSILDEIDTLAKDHAMAVWIRVLARNRKKFFRQDGTRGTNTVGITTTPEGFNFVYDLWVKIHSENSEYELIRGRTIDNHHLHEDYVPSLRRTYPPQLIEAYLNGEFVNLKGNTVYSEFDRDTSNTALTIDDFPVTQTIHIGMDFNVGRMAAVVAMKSSDFEDTKKLFVIDEFHKLMDTPAMIAAIKARYPRRSITIYPDASGRSRKSVDASKSDIRLLREAGFSINAPSKNPPVRESVVSTKAAFLNADGDRKLYVNTYKCPNLTEILEKQVYDDYSTPVKDGTEDPTDALRYLVNRVFGLAKAVTRVARLRIGA